MPLTSTLRGCFLAQSMQVVTPGRASRRAREIGRPHRLHCFWVEVEVFMTRLPRGLTPFDRIDFHRSQGRCISMAEAESAALREGGDEGPSLPLRIGLG